MSTSAKLLIMSVAMLAFGMTAAISASAAPHKWLINGAQIEAGLEFKVTTTLTKPIFLEDSLFLGQRVEIECSAIKGAGDVLANGVSRQLTLAFELCVLVVGGGVCLKLFSVTAVNLGWEAQLSGLNFKESIMGLGGNPGWSFECETFMGNLTDTCTAVFTLEATNNAVDKDVDLKAEESTELTPFTCTNSGEESGSILAGAVILVKLAEGAETLSVGA